MVVILDPGSDLLALVPSGLVPYHYQTPFSSFLSYREQILYKVQSVGAVGLTIAESQMHFPTLMVQSTEAGDSLGFEIVLTLILLQKSQWLAICCPGVHRGLSKAAEPALILIDQ